MGRVPLHYVDLRTFSYATEDEQRVEQALETFLPDEQPIEREVTEGHHGDRIVVLSTRVENADGIRHVLDRITEGDAIDDLLEELDDRVTENCELFARFDKQAAYRGDVELGEGITFRAKVEAYPAKRAAALENAREMLEALATDE